MKFCGQIVPLMNHTASSSSSSSPCLQWGGAICIIHFYITEEFITTLLLYKTILVCFVLLSVNLTLFCSLSLYSQYINIFNYLDKEITIYCALWNLKYL